MSRRRGIPGLSFSWKRATGISAAKAKLSRELGVPLSKSSRQRKAGRFLGCGVIVGLGLGVPALLRALLG